MKNKKETLKKVRTNLSRIIQLSEVSIVTLEKTDELFDLKISLEDFLKAAEFQLGRVETYLSEISSEEV